MEGITRALIKKLYVAPPKGEVPLRKQWDVPLLVRSAKGMSRRDSFGSFARPLRGTPPMSGILGSGIKSTHGGPAQRCCMAGKPARR
jgi:hypothetical protein